MINKLNELEIKIHELIKQKKSTKDICLILNKKLYEIKTLKLNIYHKLRICGKIDILNNRFNTLNPLKENKSRNNNNRRKKIEEISKYYKKEIERYRFIKDLGYSSFKACKNMSKKRFIEFCKNENINFDKILLNKN